MSGLGALRTGDSSCHGGVFQGIPRRVLVDGLDPVCAGDSHVCPMILPGGSPHPALPTGPGSSSVLVSGLVWMRNTDPTPCAGSPCQISSGSTSVLLGPASHPPESSENAPAYGYPHSL
jgi:uncharacterized Zn-binding protein involved in type VI secretion